MLATLITYITPNNDTRLVICGFAVIFSLCNLYVDLQDLRCIALCNCDRLEQMEEDLTAFYDEKLELMVDLIEIRSILKGAKKVERGMQV